MGAVGHCEVSCKDGTNALEALELAVEAVHRARGHLTNADVARSAALLVVGAHGRSGDLSRLPKEVLGLIAKDVYASRKDDECWGPLARAQEETNTEKKKKSPSCALQ